jgi:hypothetical protein
MSETSFWIRFVLAVLATWRVTHLLANEDGPADLIVRFRALFGQSVAGKMMDCFNCLSLWVAAPVAFLLSQEPVDLLLSWLALSGATCLLERLGYDPAVVHPVAQEIEGEVGDGMLRSEESFAQEPSGTNQNTGIGQRS